MLRHLLKDNQVPLVEQTPRNQNSESNNSFIRLAEAIAGTQPNNNPR